MHLFNFIHAPNRASKGGAGMGFFYGTKEIDVKQKMLSYIKDLEQTKQQEIDAMARLVKGLKKKRSFYALVQIVL